jgi:hypothetical protein
VRFNEGFASLWRWHRGTQLAAYAADLRELAAAVDDPLTREQVEGYRQRANAHGERLVEEALPGAAGVLAALSDAQVARLLRKLAEQRAEEDAERTPEETRKLYARNAVRGLKRWLGSASDEQTALVREWAASRRDDPELWRRYGEQWAAAFERTLAARAEPEFETRLRAVLDDPDLPDRDAVRELSAHNRDRYIDLLAALSPTLSDAQRRHLQKRLLGLAEDFEDLAAQRTRAAAPGATG